MEFDQLDTRNVALVPEKSALLIIDVQNFSAHRQGGEFRDLSEAEFERRYGWFFRHIEIETIPNMMQLLAACRAARIEVMYTVIESLTRDGRDRSLDYRITGFHVPRGSWDAEVLKEVVPVGDEIVLPKTSSNVFISTNIDYLLRNMGKRQLVVAGFITDQCVSSAVRDACDLGYLVTLPTDACASYSGERHAHAIESLSGYCRQLKTRELLSEIGRRVDSSANMSRHKPHTAQLKSGKRTLIGKMPMSDIARAVEKGDTRGFMKILVDAEMKHILGAAILGTGGDEVIHCVVDLMYAKAPSMVMQRAVHIHPTISELISTMLSELAPLERQVDALTPANA